MSNLLDNKGPDYASIQAPQDASITEQVTSWDKCFQEDEKCKSAYWHSTPDLTKQFDSCIASKTSEFADPSKRLLKDQSAEVNANWACLMKQPAGLDDYQYGKVGGWENYWRMPDDKRPLMKNDNGTVSIAAPESGKFQEGPQTTNTSTHYRFENAWLAIPAAGVLFFTFTTRGDLLLHGPHSYTYLGALGVLSLFAWYYHERKHA